MVTDQPAARPANPRFSSGPCAKRPDFSLDSLADAALDPLGLKDTSRNWRRIVAGQRLWYFESRDAKAWLMI